MENAPTTSVIEFNLTIPEDDMHDMPDPKKPDISGLQDAIAQGVLQFGVGDQLIIERLSLVSPGKWFDTNLYKVLEFSEITGELALWDVERKHHAKSNIYQGLMRGYKFKIPVAKPVVNEATDEEAIYEAPVVDPAVKRGRGRPPGSKNRDKEVIKAEKRQRIQRQMEKRRNR